MATMASLPAADKILRDDDATLPRRLFSVAQRKRPARGAHTEQDGQSNTRRHAEAIQGQGGKGTGMMRGTLFLIVELMITGTLSPILHLYPFPLTLSPWLFPSRRRRTRPCPDGGATCARRPRARAVRRARGARGLV